VVGRLPGPTSEDGNRVQIVTMAEVMKDEPIRFVSEFVRRLRQTPSNRRRLFRGQNTDKPLLPRIVRLAERKGIPFAKVTDLERTMLQRFRRESVPALGSIRAESDWELLSIAQHQGMPTRLLDWTANVLAGLWFAVSTDPPNNEAQGIVWVLEVDPANEKTPAPTDDIFVLRRTYVFQPFHLDRRIVAQSGWFSVHRYAQAKDSFLPLERHERYSQSLTRFVVDEARKVYRRFAAEAAARPN
jgi:hypothetical protein